MKIIFLIDTLGAGGSERSLAQMLPYFQQAGIHPLVVYLREKETGVQGRVEKGSFRLRQLPKGGLLKRALALRRLLDSEKPDLVHTTLFNANMIGRLGTAGTGVPLLTSLVNTSYDPIRIESDPNLVPWKFRIIQYIDAVTARLITTHFHAVVEAVKQAYVRDLRLRPEHITVVHRGRDPASLGVMSPERRRQARAALALEPEDEVLLNVGRQEYQKGQRYLLEAFERLADERPRLILLIAGREGRATGDLQLRLDSMKHRDRVRFLGHRSDIPEVLAAADLFVFPSLFEGIGGAIIEAMGLGLPVIASDLPGLREVVDPERSAVLVPPGDPDALARAVALLTDDPERRAAMGRRGRDRFEACFTLAKSAEGMIDLFYRVAGAERPAKSEEAAAR